MNFEVLLAGAAGAAGPVPESPQDYQRWLNRVATIAADLGAISEAVDAHEHRKNDCIALGEAEGTKKSFYGRLVNVKTVTKGSDDKKVVKGYLQFLAREDSQSVDDEGREFIETAPLSTPEGAFEYQRAQSLVGQDVIVYKRLIPLPNGRRARECAAIDPAPRSAIQSLQADNTRTEPSSVVSAVDERQENVTPATASLDDAVSHAEEIFSTESSSNQPNSSLQSMTPKTEQELVDLAGKHLGKTPEEVRAILVAKYNAPTGKSLPPRQYTTVWKELVG